MKNSQRRQFWWFRTLLLLGVGIASLLPVSVRAQAGGPPAVRSHSLTAVDPQALQLPWASWPAGTNTEKGSKLDPKVADNPASNIFAFNNFHRQSYSSHGMLGGYYQNAHVPLNSAGDYTDAFWLGSYYSGNQEADSRVADAVASMRAQGLTGQSCFLDDRPNCHVYIFQVLIYAVWSDQNGVGELLLQDPQSVSAFFTMAKNQSAVGQVIKQLLVAGDTTVAAAIGDQGGPVTTALGPQEPVLSIGIDKMTVLHDVRGKLLPTTVVRLNEVAVFSATIHLSNLGAYSSTGDLKFYFPKGHLQLIQSIIPTDTKPDTTKVIFDGSTDFFPQADGTLVLLSFGSFSSPSAIGQISAHMSANLETASDSRAVSFSVKDVAPACKKGFKAKNGQCVKARL